MAAATIDLAKIATLTNNLNGDLLAIRSLGGGLGNVGTVAIVNTQLTQVTKYQTDATKQYNAILAAAKGFNGDNGNTARAQAKSINVLVATAVKNFKSAAAMRISTIKAVKPAFPPAGGPFSTNTPIVSGPTENQPTTAAKPPPLAIIAVPSDFKGKSVITARYKADIQSGMDPTTAHDEVVAWDATRGSASALDVNRAKNANPLNLPGFTLLNKPSQNAVIASIATDFTSIQRANAAVTTSNIVGNNATAASLVGLSAPTAAVSSSGLFGMSWTMIGLIAGGGLLAWYLLAD